MAEDLLELLDGAAREHWRPRRECGISSGPFDVGLLRGWSYVRIQVEATPDGAAKITGAGGFQVTVKAIPRSSLMIFRGYHWVQPCP